MDSHSHPLIQLFLSRVRQFFREPETIFWVYFFPLILMTVLGAAFRERTSPAFSIRVDAPNDAEYSRISALLEADGLHVSPSTSGTRSSDSAQHDVDLTVIAREDGFVYSLDPARAESREARMRVDELLQHAAGRVDALETRIETLRAPGSRYIDWLIPGLMGMNIMGGGLWGVGFVAVDMRIRRLLKRFRATPMKRSHFLLALIGTRLTFLLPEMVSILTVGHFAFDLQVRGSLLTLAVVALIGAASFAGVGLLIASRAQKLETISGLMNVTMMPMWVMSGVFFSAKRFPDSVQWLIQSLPLTQLNNALRGVILEGASLADSALSLGVLATWGVVSFALALRIFRWQ